MALTKKSRELMEEALSVLPSSDEDIVLRGVAESLTDRIVELKKTVHKLQDNYGSLNQLEEKIETEGVPADNHQLYQDLLEWRSAEDELEKLFDILEKI